MTDYIHFPIQANSGDVIEVVIDRAANVQLLDPRNFEDYKSRRTYHYIGGYAKVSPVRLTVPRDDLWHVVVDLGGGAGRVRASAGLIANATT